MANHPPLAISTTALRKSYGRKLVLDGIDLDVAAGSVLALLGPNGAGKTTMVQIMSTLIRPDSGRVLVGGHDAIADPGAVRRLIGVTGQNSAVDNLLTGTENLSLMADLVHLSRVEGRRRVVGLLERFELVDAARQPVATYSGGMRRRLDLAMTLVGDPRIIFLDEPTTGLDPRSRRTMWQIIRNLVADGVTILLTTQYLEEADQLADQVALLDHGRIIAQGTPDELKRRIPGGHIRLQFTQLESLEAAARALGVSTSDTSTSGTSASGTSTSDTSTYDTDALTLDVPGDGGVRTLRYLLAELDRADIDVAGLSVHTPDLDDVFLTLTGTTEEGALR